jgi:Rad3-related DNA helicase
LLNDHRKSHPDGEKDAHRPLHMPIASILGPGGAVARRLTNYEARPQQLAMADAVAKAIATRRHLMVEAGTGVGKSFAYLVPAILAATADKDCRVVVSTHTISLQEQLLRKDIPFLQTVMPQEFKAVLVKGRSNYVSLRRLRVAQQRAGSLLVEDHAVQHLASIGTWSRHTLDGSKSDLEFQPLPAVWDLVESDSGNCLGRNCKDYQKCFYFRARKQIHGANILIVNHALFFSDLALRRAGASLLPDYKVAILDEAHTLEDVAADHLGIQVSCVLRGASAACWSPSATTRRSASWKRRAMLPSISSAQFVAGYSDRSPQQPATAHPAPARGSQTSCPTCWARSCKSLRLLWRRSPSGSTTKNIRSRCWRS